MRFGIVILPQEPWAKARYTWAAAESLGFDHAWTYDHLSWRSLADQRWGATIPILTAAATVTRRIRLGTFVSSPNFRHPVTFAKEVATLDDVSGGRFTLGVGSGGTGFDASVLGQPSLSPRERHGRFAEFVEQLDGLLRFESDGPISFRGHWFSANEARMVGVPAQLPRVPFAEGARARWPVRAGLGEHRQGGRHR
jgi:alkanesulfonate monooxygenase SsuD/methylene tetrahydromethanopterin reductase-like flavin-dependent oxidoreductase (luciferase family)